MEFSIKNNILTGEDQEFFKNWIELNLMGISWEGRYLSEFNDFWNKLFTPNKSILDQFEDIKYFQRNLKVGPIISWGKWVADKFTAYCFIYKGASIRELSTISNQSPSDLATSLRIFFTERFPNLVEVFNEQFLIGNSLSENLDLTFLKLDQQLNLDPTLIRGSLEGEVFTGLELTLYSEWENLKKFKDSKIHDDKNKTIVEKPPIIHVKFIQELLLLFVLGGVLIFAIKVGNKWYEDYLVKEISIFEPNFFWLDKNLAFKGDKSLDPKDISISLDELEELEKLESKKFVTSELATTRFEVESDVVLTSVDSLPKDFDVADLEQSTYEETKKGGYRNNRYGRRKAYRVMLTSVDPVKTKLELLTLLKEFDVKQVDNVKPGTKIPGGIYFNLHVQRKLLKHFLSKLSSVEESTILESKTLSRGPANSSRVFIWIKSI
jgi:hypothetical protein